MQFSFIPSEGVCLTNTRRLLPKSSNLDLSVYSAFFNHLKSNSCAVVPNVVVSSFLFCFNRGFLTDTHSLSQTERSLFLTAITDIGCWRVELNSAVSSRTVLFFFFLSLSFPLVRYDQVSIICNKYYSLLLRSFSVNICAGFCMSVQPIMQTIWVFLSVIFQQSDARNMLL